MKLLPVAIGAGIFYALYKVQSGQNVADALKFDIDVFSFKIQGTSPVLTLSVKLINPSTSGTTVNSFSGNITWQKKSVADITYLNTIVIKPKTVLTVKIPVKFNIIESITALFVLITNKSKRLCNVHMDFFTPLGKVPYDKEILIGAPAIK